MASHQFTPLQLVQARRRPGIPPRIPQAHHRHATPAGPWPFVDTKVEQYAYITQQEQAKLDKLNEEARGLSSGVPWKLYPRCLFPNWTHMQQKTSGILKLITSEIDPNVGEVPCIVYYIDIDRDGLFCEPGSRSVVRESERAFWEMIEKTRRPDGSRCRAVFIENMSGAVMQMLGYKYQIEPFFFTSSLNWIPSRYQENLNWDEGDHITIVLPFLRALEDPTGSSSPTSVKTRNRTRRMSTISRQIIDTQAPLEITSSDHILALDLLAVHMIRRNEGSTVISFHPAPEWKATSAQHLHSRVSSVGQSVYWQNIFKDSKDPTLLLLVLFYYPLYAWDEALETLYAHICYLESRVLSTNDLYLTRELHVIRASLLHYESLLEDFRLSVEFLLATPNPCLRIEGAQTAEEAEERRVSKELLEKECSTILEEIQRLEHHRKMQDARLDNVVNLAFSTVNFEDSQQTKAMAEASLRDSKVMKQISYLTMVFLPASFVSSFFGMNIGLLTDGGRGTLAGWFYSAIPLTAVTIWVIVALHSGSGHEDPLWLRIGWPYFSCHAALKNFALQVRRRWGLLRHRDKQELDDLYAV